MAEAKKDAPKDPQFPKWLHKDWKLTPEKAPGHHVPGNSKLVQTAEEAKELLATGWTEKPPEPKKDAKEK